MKGTILKGSEIDLGEIKLTPRKIWPTLLLASAFAYWYFKKNGQ